MSRQTTNLSSSNVLGMKEVQMLDGICPIFIFQVLFKQCEGTCMMKFTLEKLKPYIIPSAILLFTDFTRDHFWSRFEKLAALKRTLSQKSLCCTRVLIKLQFHQNGSSRQILLKNLLGGSFFSVKSRVYSCNFIKNGLHLRGFLPLVLQDSSF